MLQRLLLMEQLRHPSDIILCHGWLAKRLVLVYWRRGERDLIGGVEVESVHDESKRERQRETERQRQRETERQRDRETERQRDRERERERERRGEHNI